MTGMGQRFIEIPSQQNDQHMGVFSWYFHHGKSIGNLRGKPGVPWDDLYFTQMSKSLGFIV